jgi:hypothetical protein
MNATLDVSQATDKQQFLTYVRSNERVGFHDTTIAIAYYIGLAISYILLFLYIVYRKELKHIRRRHTPLYLLIIVAYIVIFIIIYARFYGIYLVI